MSNPCPIISQYKANFHSPSVSFFFVVIKLEYHIFHVFDAFLPLLYPAQTNLISYLSTNSINSTYSISSLSAVAEMNSTNLLDWVCYPKPYPQDGITLLNLTLSVNIGTEHRFLKLLAFNLSERRIFENHNRWHNNFWRSIYYLLAYTQFSVF